MAIADRVAAAFAQPFSIDGVEHFVSASIGDRRRPARRPDEPVDAELLIRDADAAMYRAKERGRARCELFDAEMRARGAAPARGRARAAPARSSATSWRCTTSRSSPCAPARSPASRRWSAGSHPERGLLDPAEFIPVAEDSGLIEPIGRWVQEARLPPGARVARAAPRRAPARRRGQPLRPPGRPPRPAGDGRRDPRPHRPRPGPPAAGDHRERPGRGVGDGDRDSLEALNELGVAPRPRRLRHRLLLARLPQPLPLRRAEDRPLLRRRARGSSRSATAIVEAIIGMARALSLDVIAEGVENEVQLSELRRLGCDYAQGHLFHAALPARRGQPAARRRRARAIRGSSPGR